jgi:uncharacterized protein involved in exopolysaccharide biosynthesis
MLRDDTRFALPPGTPSGTAAEGPTEILFLLYELRRRWWFIALLGLTAAAAAWYRSSTQPVVYSAEVLLQRTETSTFAVVGIPGAREPSLALPAGSPPACAGDM